MVARALTLWLTGITARRVDVEALQQQPSFQPDARVLKRQVQEDRQPPT